MRRNVSAWTGLALLAFNLIAGALLPAQAASPANQLAQQAYICTALGMVAVSPDGTPEPGQGSHDVSLCVYCLPLLSGGFDGPAAQATLEAPLSVALADYEGLAPALISPQPRHNSAAPRAPPAL
jgi:hypothetical protein